MEKKMIWTEKANNLKQGWVNNIQYVLNAKIPDKDKVTHLKMIVGRISNFNFNEHTN